MALLLLSMCVPGMFADEATEAPTASRDERASYAPGECIEVGGCLIGGLSGDSLWSSHCHDQWQRNWVTRAVMTALSLLPNRVRANA